MGRILTITALLLCIFNIDHACASHILGGGFTYQFIDSASGKYHYKIRLTLYQDCLTGQPQAIAQDNPAFFTIYKNSDIVYPYELDTTAYYDSASSVSIEFATHCGAYTPMLSSACMLRKIFERDYYFPPDSLGYTIVYQRCCRNAALVNIVNSGDDGITLYCKIPPVGIVNNSAEFKSNPLLVACNGNALAYDVSAYDADGDSLSYELAPCYKGANDNTIKPLIASAPPFDTLNYMAGFSYANPMGTAPVTYNPLTGQLTMTPDRVGIYSMGVSVHEWRNGTLINTSMMDFHCFVLDCGIDGNTFHPNAGRDTIIYTAIRCILMLPAVRPAQAIHGRHLIS